MSHLTYRFELKPYAKNKHIGVCRRLVHDLFKVSEASNKEEFLLKTDIEKILDSINHSFSIVQSRYAFV